MSNFCTSRYRRARKQHDCAECRRPIEAGETYLRVAGATDGYGWSFPLCLPCDALYEFARDTWKGHEEDGPTYGGLVAWLADYEVPHVLAATMPAAVAGHWLGLLFASAERRIDVRAR